MEPISYLVWLQHKPMPITLSTAQEIRLVSVLKVAGLLEASMRVAPDARGRYWRAAEAVVCCITDEGREVINEYLLDRREIPSRCLNGKDAHMEYLRAIADAKFPLRVEEPAAIGSIAVLRAAGFVEATLTSLNSGSQPFKVEQALLLRITPLGMKAIQEKSD